MASNNERVGKALELLNAGLRPFVEREMRKVYKDRWIEEMVRSRGVQRTISGRHETPHFDSQSFLATMWRQWDTVFGNVLERAERSLVSELIEARNRWAHQNLFSTPDAHRAVDSIHRLLAAIHAEEAAEVDRQGRELVHILSQEQSTRDRPAAPSADRPVSTPRRTREAGSNAENQDVWGSIRGLEGRTLLTTSQRRPFDVVQVTDGAVFVEPHSTRRQRRVARVEFEEAIGVRSSGERLRPIDVQLANASTRNSVYVVAILYALEEPIV